ncbi:hypothetical protein HHS34_005600 [Acidithiobacillus montserratensis]|uniref:Uncharacterized protein n=1 Tax=Acidithiobacillus montserratensis TaxID=2729135 RepID=A0ACD5HJ31_9PROT|nr:hypothetical protein [Acidithiobacillus montserratensis]
MIEILPNGGKQSSGNVPGRAQGICTFACPGSRPMYLIGDARCYGMAVTLWHLLWRQLVIQRFRRGQKPS